MPADALLHPMAMLAVIALLANDHIAKALWPGVVTGKVSDIAGLAFFPLFLVGIWEVAQSGLGRWKHPTVTPIVVASLATASVFTLVKTTILGATVWAGFLGAGRYLAGVPAAVLTGANGPAFVAVTVVRDATDLVALPAILVANWIGVRRAQSAMPWRNASIFVQWTLGRK